MRYETKIYLGGKTMQQENYEIRVERNQDGSGVLITVDGETHSADGFEFSAPLGTGLAVKKITRLELVPEERPQGRIPQPRIP